MSSVEDFVVDFSKEEESGGGGIRIKEGTYPVKIIAAKPTVSAEKGTHGLELVLRITEGKYKGKKLKETLWASPKAYSRFRLLLEAIGKRVPAKIKLAAIAKGVKGATLYVEVEDDTREGYSTRSRVTFQGFINEDDYGVEDEEPDEDEDDEDLEDDEDEDLEDEEDEEEEEEEEPPKKSRRKKAAPAAAKKRSKRKPKKEEEEDEDDEDLEDLDLDDL